MKPSSRDPQLGLASPLNYAANRSGKIKIKSPSKKEAGAGCKSPALASREGTGETFFLDILFHRMSEIDVTPVEDGFTSTGVARRLAESSRRLHFTGSCENKPDVESPDHCKRRGNTLSIEHTLLRRCRDSC